MLEITREYALQIQVCTDLKDEKKIEKQTNEKHFCGTKNGWVIDKKIEPVQCSKYPERKHYMMTC